MKQLDRVYDLGYEHGEAGKPFLAHRKGKSYRRQSYQFRYEAGYKAGVKARSKNSSLVDKKDSKEK